MSTQVYRIQYEQSISLVETTQMGIAQHIAALSPRGHVCGYAPVSDNELMALIAADGYVRKLDS